jgi:hypothetical protein
MTGSGVWRRGRSSWVRNRAHADHNGGCTSSAVDRGAAPRWFSDLTSRAGNEIWSDPDSVVSGPRVGACEYGGGATRLR